MQKAKYKLVYNRKRKLNRDNKALIQIEIYLNKKRKYISTGIYVKTDHWDYKNKEINAHNGHYIFLNKILKEKIREIEDYEIHLIDQKKNHTLDDLIIRSPEIVNFLEFYEKELAVNNTIGPRTRKSYHTTLKRLKEFKPKISLHNINYEFIQQFEYFLRSKKFKVNTIHGYHKNLKVYLNLAIKKELIDINKNPYLRFKVKLEESVKVSLTSQELTDLENQKFNDHAKDLEFARDIFLFSCYTGIRFADVFNLTKSNLEESKEGGMTLKFRMIKSNKYINLPLHLLYNGKPQKMVRKYVSEYSEFLFPKKSNQHINRQLKLIAILASIKKRLTYHVARHTFGTNLADILADPYLIKELMGHAKISTSMIYIHNSQERINKKLKAVKWDNK